MISVGGHSRSLYGSQRSSSSAIISTCSPILERIGLRDRRRNTIVSFRWSMSSTYIWKTMSSTRTSMIIISSISRYCERKTVSTVLDNHGRLTNRNSSSLVHARGDVADRCNGPVHEVSTFCHHRILLGRDPKCDCQSHATEVEYPQSVLSSASQQRYWSHRLFPSRRIASLLRGSASGKYRPVIFGVYGQYMCRYVNLHTNDIIGRLATWSTRHADGQSDIL